MLKRIAQLVPLVALIFVGGGGCGGCGPTSPGRTCAQWVSDQTGTSCQHGNGIGSICTPVVTKTCVRWSCG